METKNYSVVDSVETLEKAIYLSIIVRPEGETSGLSYKR